MTYQGRWTDQGAERKWRFETLVAIAIIVTTSIDSAATAPFKSDFRGLETGMTVPQAVAAASKAGMTCETNFTGQTTCGGGGATVVLKTTGRDGNLVWELQVTLAGHFDNADMKAKLDGFYGLKPTAVPDVYDTASGQELMLLEIGQTATVFYLRNPAVLHGDPPALPPPKF